MNQSEPGNLWTCIGTLTYRFTISVSIAVFVTTNIVLFLQILWHCSFLERKLLLLPPSKIFPGVWGRLRQKGLYFVSDVLDNIFKICFLILRCVWCFYETFPQIKFFHFSGEALILPSAFIYFAVVSLLVPAACKIFCRRIRNLMLVTAAAQFIQ